MNIVTAFSSLIGNDNVQLSHWAHKALEYDRHPQERTRLFHETFDAPIRDTAPDMTFSHMDDQRVAFRVSFILSEMFEMLEKGLGIGFSIAFRGEANGLPTSYGAPVTSSRNADLCSAILEAMQKGHKRDVIQVFDALGDLNVVVNGFAVELGGDMRAVDQEILASNLTKLDENGQPIVADGSDPRYPAGKVLKGPNYVEPQLAVVLGLAA